MTNDTTAPAVDLTIARGPADSAEGAFNEIDADT